MKNDLQNLNQSLQEVQALNQLALAISSTTDLDQIINTIIDQATGLTGARQGSILLTKDETDSRFTTLIRVGKEKHESLIQKMCMVIAGWILKNEKPLLVNDILIDDRFKGLELLGYPVKAVLSVPIKARGEILGVLILHSQGEEKNFAENDLRLLNIIASQSAPVLQNASLLHKLKEENLHLKKEIERKYGFEEIVGRSETMEKVFKLLEKVIPTDVRVLIHGESGTGKELIARAIHYNGSRKDKRFVAIDCGALPENLLESELFGHEKGAFTNAMETKSGIFERANGGTIFLEEIENLEWSLQAKLLTVLEDKKIRRVGGSKDISVDFRLISASNDHIANKVQEGNFRPDLFYRLRGTELYLPPLRERKEDLLELAEHFLEIYNKSIKSKKKLSNEVKFYLRNYSWPGNIRELKFAVEEAAVKSVSDEIQVNNFSIDFRNTLANIEDNKDHKTLVEEERRHIEVVLNSVQFNKTRAAKILGIGLNTLYRKIDKYGIKNV
ncbi:sigma-54-dependent Fis family transcriptional regulator [candidate division KSB1 bacterium]|nr:sigma-54-dependent Fis family transcriptional regulator [candidate division KSB1 bacterium]